MTLTAVEMPDITITPLPDRKIDFRNHREMLEANLGRQIESIRAADIKIALLVPTTTVMMGVLAALLRDYDPAHGKLIWAVLSAAPLIAAFVIMASGVIPRLRGNPARSLLFLGDLSSHEMGEVRDALLSVSPQDYLADLAAQCHATAGIARTKHVAVRRAYLAFMLAVPFWLVAIWALTAG